MKPQIQAALHQAIINQLMPETVSFTPTMTFNGIKAHGIIHNALTAHGATTHQHWSHAGYAEANKVDVIPVSLLMQDLPVLNQLLADFDLPSRLPASLLHQAF